DDYGGLGCGVLATVASTSQSTASDWHRPWFLALMGFFAFVALLGLYIVFADVVHRLPPRDWTVRVASNTPSGTLLIENAGGVNASRLSLGSAVTDHDEWLLTVNDLRITNQTGEPASLDF